MAQTKTNKPKSQHKRESATSSATEVSVFVKLKKPAKDINSCLERAKKSDSRASDLRLTAAQMLAAAKKTCDSSKVNFKKWCEKNIDGAYETARKLVTVGQAKVPALALEDLRAADAKRAKKSRDTKKKSGPSAGRVVNRGNAAVPVDDYIALLDAGLSLSEDKRLQLAGELAGKDGMSLVTREEQRAIREKQEKSGAVVSVAGAQVILGGLSYLDKRKVLQWLTRQCEEEASDGLGIPAENDRRTLAQKKAAKGKGGPVSALRA